MRNRNHPAHYMLLILASLVLLFTFNGNPPAEHCESDFVEAVSGDYFSAREYGSQRPLAPLPYLAGHLCEQVFPGNMWAQRSLSALLVMLCSMFLMSIIRKLGWSRNIALTSALVFLTFWVCVRQGRTVGQEVWGLCFILGGISTLISGLTARCRGLGWMLLSGAMMGAAFLSNSFLPFYTVLLPFSIAYGLTIRPGWRSKKRGLALLGATAVIVSSLWPLGLAIGGESDIVQVLKSSIWFEARERNLWYYWMFPLTAGGIWVFFWTAGFVYYFCTPKKRKKRRIYALSVTWSVMALALISLLPIKSGAYLSAIGVPGAVTVAMYLWNIMRSRPGKAASIIFRLTALFTACLILVIPVMILTDGLSGGEQNLEASGIVFAVIFTLLSLVIIVGSSRKTIRVRTIFSAAVLSAMLLAVYFPFGS